MTAPTSQKADARPISFHLDDQANGFGMGPAESITLTIRPEDLSRVEPSRTAVQQTLGGAWLDSFGAGVKTVTLSGHTGWRPPATGGVDGLQQFKNLHANVFTKWHDRRALAVSNGKNPDDVRLIFADALDDFVYLVAPGPFVLRRSKSRPLLVQYQINLTVLGDLGSSAAFLAPPSRSPFPGESLDLGLLSLDDTMGRLQGLADTVAGFIDGTLGVATRTFLGVTQSVLGVVRGVVGGVTRAFDTVMAPVIQSGMDLMQAGRNVFQTFASVAGLASHVRNTFQQVAALYHNAFCLLRNAFRLARDYPDYSDLYGASTCSSTSGGRPMSPLRNENPFYKLNNVVQMPVQMSQEAQASAKTLALMDPVLAPASNSSIEAHLSSIARGTATTFQAAA